MTEPLSLFGAQDAARAYEENLAQLVFLPFAAHLVALTKPTADEDVLDLACGTGAVTRLLVQRRGPDRLTGLDLTDAMLDVARSLLPNVTFVSGDMQALPMEDASVDLVLCQQGLQFVPDRSGAVREMHRVLRPGGRVAVAAWVEVTRIPVFNGFRNGLVALGWDDLVASFAAPFSLAADELRSLFGAFDDVEVAEVPLDLPVDDAVRIARTYASVPPFSARFLAASETDQQRYLTTAADGIRGTEPFTTSLLTATRGA